MLFDPSEEQFDLPPGFVDLSDRQRRQLEVVGQEDKPLAGLRVAVGDPPQWLGIAFGGLGAAQKNRLIAGQPRRLVDPSVRAPAVVEVLLAPDYEESQAQSEAAEPAEI